MRQRQFDRILICGAIYARNLGDGVLAECFAYALRDKFPDIPVAFVDLSGRDDYTEHAVKGKDQILSALRVLPGFATRTLVVAGLTHFLIGKAWPKWRHLFRDGDLVIIGGGHLLSDYNLNFPAKLLILTHFARMKNTKRVIFSVGVSKNWSRLGAALLRRVIKDADPISVRDRASRDRLTQSVPEVASRLSITADPGYLARLAYAEVPATAAGVGLNVSEPNELNAYEAKESASPRARYDELWIQLARHFTSTGRQVTFFTNGADEDEAYLNHLQDSAPFRAIRDKVTVLPRPSDPASLVGMIKSLDLLIGHRLHAQIVAFVHGIPSVALGWDDKLASQLEIMGRSRFLVPFDQATAEAVIHLADAAGQDPIDMKRREAIETAALNDIETIMNTACPPEATDSAVRVPA